MGRTAKAPGKPKGKMSAYSFFVQASREEQKQKEPNKTVSLSVFSKQASEKWKAMGEKEKKKYVDLAANDDTRYKQEMANYTPADTEDTKKRKRVKKDPNAPKRSMSSFFWFANDERAKIKAESGKLSVKDVAKELGRRWETCKDKPKYEALAAKDKQRYELEKANYVNGQSNGDVKKPAARAAKKTTKPPAKKSKNSKETEDEEDEDEDDVEDQDDDDEDEEDEESD